MQEIIFVGILGVLAYIDMKERKIPNVLLLSAAAVRILLFLLKEGLQVTGFLALLGNGLAISLPLWMLTMLMDWWLKKKTMGGGDIKLIFITGLYLGWEMNLIMLLMAGIFALVFCAVRKERELPFGPAIALSTVCIIIFGALI